MKKPTLEVSYGDLKWMSGVYFELYSVNPFLERLYEIIEDKEKSKEFCEALKKYYYYPGKTEEEVREIIGKMYKAKTDAELEELYKYIEEVSEIIKKFGFGKEGGGFYGP